MVDLPRERLGIIASAYAFSRAVYDLTRDYCFERKAFGNRIGDLQTRTVDRCVQLHGGYGCMLEYPVAKAFIDSRVQTIYDVTTEIMKEVIGRDLTPVEDAGR